VSQSERGEEDEGHADPYENGVDDSGNENDVAEAEGSPPKASADSRRHAIIEARRKRKSQSNLKEESDDFSPGSISTKKDAEENEDGYEPKTNQRPCQKRKAGKKPVSGSRTRQKGHSSRKR
jgi:hypothetical protein